MTKIFKATVSLFLVLATVFSITVIGFAATSVSSVNCSGTSSTGASDKYFYVKTSDSILSHKITFTMTKGTLESYTLKYQDMPSMSKSFSVYAPYEITIWYKSGSSWVQEQNFDIYCAAKKDVTLNKKNTVYKIQVHSWKSITTYNSYKKNGKIVFSITDSHYHCEENPYWSKMPKCTVTNNARCTLYTSCP